MTATSGESRSLPSARGHVTARGIPKKGWTDRRHAGLVARAMQDEGKHVEVYLCGECSEFHVGRPRGRPGRRQRRRDSSMTTYSEESNTKGAEATVSELSRIDVLAMILQGRDGDHASEFWRSRAHRLLNHPGPLLAVLGLGDLLVEAIEHGDCRRARAVHRGLPGVALQAAPGACPFCDMVRLLHPGAPEEIPQ